MTKALIIITLTLLSSVSFGQKNTPDREQRRIISLLQSTLNRKAIKDTNEIVMFAYKVHIRRQSGGNYKVVSSSVSDSVAYLYFGNPDFLKTIDYNLFTRNKKEATIILPMAILISYPTKSNGGFVSIDSLSAQLINYLYLHDEKSVSIDTSNFIYLPIGIMKTSSAIDY